jgi:hypothetical protein
VGSLFNKAMDVLDYTAEVFAKSEARNKGNADASLTFPSANNPSSNRQQVL